MLVYTRQKWTFVDNQKVLSIFFKRNKKIRDCLIKYTYFLKTNPFKYKWDYEGLYYVYRPKIEYRRKLREERLGLTYDYDDGIYDICFEYRKELINMYFDCFGVEKHFKIREIKPYIFITH